MTVGKGEMENITIGKGGGDVPPTKGSNGHMTIRKREMDDHMTVGKERGGPAGGEGRRVGEKRGGGGGGGGEGGRDRLGRPVLV